MYTIANIINTAGINYSTVDDHFSGFPGMTTGKFPLKDCIFIVLYINYSLYFNCGLLVCLNTCVDVLT